MSECETIINRSSMAIVLDIMTRYNRISYANLRYQAGICGVPAVDLDIILESLKNEALIYEPHPDSFVII